VKGQGEVTIIRCAPPGTGSATTTSPQHAAKATLKRDGPAMFERGWGEWRSRSATQAASEEKRTDPFSIMEGQVLDYSTLFVESFNV
jgi:hypothetical protein